MKPLISYYGGKQRMAPKIVPLIPPHTVYCEPFAGGAAVFYAKPLPPYTNNNHYRETLNDINGDLVNMYRVAKSRPGDFSASLETIPFSSASYRGRKIKYERDEDRALAFYVNTQMSFSHVIDGGFQRGTYGRNLASSFFRRKQGAMERSARLDEVTLDSIDAVDFIRKWDSPHTFFYIDPPYLGTRIDGMGKWGPDDLAALVNTLNDCRGSYIMSAYGLHGNALKNSTVLQFKSHCGASGGGKTQRSRNHNNPIKPEGKERIELLYMRGPTAPVRSLLVPVLEKQTCFTGPLLGPCPLPLKTHPSARRQETGVACAT